VQAESGTAPFFAQSSENRGWTRRDRCGCRPSRGTRRATPVGSARPDQSRFEKTIGFVRTGAAGAGTIFPGSLSQLVPHTATSRRGKKFQPPTLGYRELHGLFS
jgi:hypothetical protein